MDQWNSTNRNLNLRPFITVKNIRHLTKKHLGFNQPREQTCGFRQIVFFKADKHDFANAICGVSQPKVG